MKRSSGPTPIVPVWINGTGLTEGPPGTWTWADPGGDSTLLNDLTATPLTGLFNFSIDVTTIVAGELTMEIYTTDNQLLTAPIFSGPAGTYSGTIGDETTTFQYMILKFHGTSIVVTNMQFELT